MHDFISKEFMDIYKTLGFKYDYRETFFNFLKMSSIAIYNAFANNQKLEDEYLSTINIYNKKDQDLFPRWFAELVMLYERQEQPTDILGPFYENQNLNISHIGQFFTPTHISDFMAECIIDDGTKIKKAIVDKGYITFNEPTCGAGGMIISFAKALKSKHINYQKDLLVVANDISDICVYMTYIQLSLQGIPAIVCCGDTLTQEIRFKLETPLYFLYSWKFKDSFTEQKLEKNIIKTQNQVMANTITENKFTEVSIKGNCQISLF